MLCEPSLLAVWENAAKINNAISDKLALTSNRLSHQSTGQQTASYWSSAGRALKQIKHRHSYREPTGAGGTGAPSRSAFVERRVLLAANSFPGLFLLSLPTSAGFFVSSNRTLLISRLSEPVSSSARWVRLRPTVTSTQGEAAGEAALIGIECE